ncbi:MAG: flagellar hook-length control protein FliK [Phycisphaerales bacterium]
MYPLPQVPSASSATGPALIVRSQERDPRPAEDFTDILRRAAPLDTSAAHAALPPEHSAESSAASADAPSTPGDERDAPDADKDSGADEPADGDEASSPTASLHSADLIGSASLSIHALNAALLHGGATAQARRTLVRADTDPGRPAGPSSGRHDRADARAGVAGETSRAAGVSPPERDNAVRISSSAGTPPAARPASDAPRDHSPPSPSTTRTPAAPNPRPAESSEPPAAAARASQAAEAALSAHDAIRRLVLADRPSPCTPPRPDSAGARTAAPLGATSSANSIRPAERAPTRASAAPAAQHDHEPVSIQLLRGVRLAVARASSKQSPASSDSAIISLKPESLGKVTVRVDVRDGVVRADFESHTALAHELLKSSIAELRQHLEARGVSVDRIQVSLREEPPLAQPIPGAESPRNRADADLPPQDAPAGSDDPGGSVGDGPHNHPPRDEQGATRDRPPGSHLDADTRPAEPAWTERADESEWTPIGLVDRLA